jgi:multiple sugar transport system substrate-binding protein
MEELLLSVMPHANDSIAQIRPFLQQFEERHGVKVQVQLMDWNTGRSVLVRTALRHQGPDVSEVGTTWVADLIGMNVLRSFTRPELQLFGDSSAFVAPSWKTCQIVGDERVWAVPWLVEALIILYHRDLLQQAGLNSNMAFQSFEQIEHTCRQLQRQGLPAPIALPSRLERGMVAYSLAGWIWDAGGDFCSFDGREVLFDRPEALAGLRRYYTLAQLYQPEGAKQLELAGLNGIFRNRQAAIALAVQNVQVNRDEFSAEEQASWGSSPMPGDSFVGGSNLVIWSHTRKERLALELVRFLTSLPVQTSFNHRVGMLPARLAVMNQPEYAKDPVYQVALQAMSNARAIPSISLWGLLEDAFIGASLQAWTALAGHPEADVDQAIQAAFLPAARRVRNILAG